VHITSATSRFSLNFTFKRLRIICSLTRYPPRPTPSFPIKSLNPKMLVALNLVNRGGVCEEEFVPVEEVLPAGTLRRGFYFSGARRVYLDWKDSRELHLKSLLPRLEPVHTNALEVASSAIPSLKAGETGLDCLLC
jgi:hypothetical protein